MLDDIEQEPAAHGSVLDVQEVSWRCGVTRAGTAMPGLLDSGKAGWHAGDIRLSPFGEPRSNRTKMNEQESN